MHGACHTHLQLLPLACPAPVVSRSHHALTTYSWFTKSCSPRPATPGMPTSDRRPSECGCTDECGCEDGPDTLPVLREGLKALLDEEASCASASCSRRTTEVTKATYCQVQAAAATHQSFGCFMADITAAATNLARHLGAAWLTHGQATAPEAGSLRCGVLHVVLQLCLSFLLQLQENPKS